MVKEEDGLSLCRFSGAFKILEGKLFFLNLTKNRIATLRGSILTPQFMKLNILLLFLLAGFSGALFAQSGSTIRGNIYDKDSGEPIIYGTVVLKGANFGTNTDFDGFFSFGNIPAGNYKLVATYIGYDSVALDITVKEGAIVYKSLYMTPSAVNLETVNVSSRREQARGDVQVSKVTVTPKQIRSLPSTGGESDIAQ